MALRPLTLADVTDAYVGWMNDPEVNRFMETRHAIHDRASIELFVADKAASPADHLLAIVELDGDRHAGNLKIGPVDARHRSAWLSYFIGERSAWGRGLAGEAVALAVRLAFERLNLAKLNAGVYAPNIASARVLEKAGFL
ncbi:MAG TPA: GNAT family N-acetyltransferase, partial [Caulobacteraceae bacterium]